MAVPANSQTTFVSAGDREDLSDIIYNIDPTDTPFLMMAGRGTATGIKHEWQLDELAAAGQNIALQGDDPGLTAAVATKRVANYAQISTKAIGISGTMEAIDKAGRDSELSYQLAKRSKELKRDIEYQCVGATPAESAAVIPLAGAEGVAGSVSTGFDIRLASHVTNAANPVLAGTHTSVGAGAGDLGGWNSSTALFTGATNGTARPLLESDLKAAIQGAWTNGGNPSVVMCGPFNKTVISAFTGNSTRMDMGEDKRLTASIDIYVSDFGEHKIIPNRFSRADHVYGFTPELWSVDYLRPFRQHALSKTGDSEKRQLLAEWTLAIKNQSGNAFVADLTSA
jgi:hypothetical protein